MGLMTQLQPAHIHIVSNIGSLEKDFVMMENDPRTAGMAISQQELTSINEHLEKDKLIDLGEFIQKIPRRISTCYASRPWAGSLDEYLKKLENFSRLTASTMRVPPDYSGGGSYLENLKEL
jgi:hypothetical protein